MGLRQGGPTIDLHTLYGATFRGQDNNTNSFHFSIPTPARATVRDEITGKTRVTTAFLSRAYVLYRAAANVRVEQIELLDGARTSFDSFIVDRLGVDLPGLAGGRRDLREGITQFTLSPPVRMTWALGIAVLVKFEASNRRPGLSREEVDTSPSRPLARSFPHRETVGSVVALDHPGRGGGYLRQIRSPEGPRSVCRDGD